MKIIFPKELEITHRPQLNGETKYAVIAHGINRQRMVSYPHNIHLEERRGSQTYLCTDGRDVFTAELPMWMPERVAQHIVKFVAANGLEQWEKNYDAK